MNLQPSPRPITRPDTHYVFVEKVGPFQDTAPAAWTEFHKAFAQIRETNEVTGVMALYKMKPEMVYRAGATIAAKPAKPLPAGFRYELVPGGNFEKWTLKGSYAQLPQASGAVWDDVKKRSVATRDGFNVENYVNSPETTPEDQLITEILVACE